ncbi:MAG: hypothetical protein ACQEWF_22240 [Bacillota bacterium]
MNDGLQIEGIIQDMDQDSVTMMVPEDIDAEQVRQFGYGYDNNDFNDYGRPLRRRYRRFHRRRFPYVFFRRLFLYPYYNPYFPGYGY